MLRARGYTPASTSDYHPTQALRVLIGIRAGSGDGYGQQAFFFVNGRYIGTDASDPSAALRVVTQSDTSVTLAYPLYRNGDPSASILTAELLKAPGVPDPPRHGVAVSFRLPRYRRRRSDRQKDPARGWVRSQSSRNGS